jgi:hypothetical protein
MDAGYVAALSGLIGAAIGSASSIATMVIQARTKDRRDRSKQLTDMALAEFKMHLDLATSGRGPTAVAPVALFLYSNDLVLKAIEGGSYTPDKAREISALVGAMDGVVKELDKQWQADQRRRRASDPPS